MPSLINKTYTRRMALEIARANRAHPFTRVSQEFLTAAESALREWMTRRIEGQPSKGKTLN